MSKSALVISFDVALYPVVLCEVADYEGGCGSDVQFHAYRFDNPKDSAPKTKEPDKGSDDEESDEESSDGMQEDNVAVFYTPKVSAIKLISSEEHIEHTGNEAQPLYSRASHPFRNSGRMFDFRYKYCMENAISALDLRSPSRMLTIFLMMAGSPVAEAAPCKVYGADKWRPRHGAQIRDHQHPYRHCLLPRLLCLLPRRLCFSCSRPFCCLWTSP
jgi:hypothetical protein